MTTKLTLTINDSVIEISKKYAKRKGKSLSSLVENYLKTLTSKTDVEENIAPAIKKLMGIIQLPDNFDHKKELGKALSKKYK